MLSGQQETTDKLLHKKHLSGHVSLDRFFFFFFLSNLVWDTVGVSSYIVTFKYYLNR